MKGGGPTGDDKAQIDLIASARTTIAFTRAWANDGGVAAQRRGHT